MVINQDNKVCIKYETILIFMLFLIVIIIMLYSKTCDYDKLINKINKLSLTEIS